MGLMDKVKATAEQAAAKTREAALEAQTKTREAAQELQTKRELGQAYSELGKQTFELVQAGELPAERFGDQIERIRTLRAQADD